MKKQKRFSTAIEIVAEVERLKKVQEFKVRKAEELGIEKQRLKELTLLPETERPSINSLQDDIGFLNKKIRMLGRTAELIESKKLPRLKEALAAMQTGTFGFSNEDRSVILTP